MKNIKKQLSNTLKNGNSILGVFRETLVKAEKHKEQVGELKDELINQQNELSEMINDLTVEGKQTENVITQMKKILGQY